MRRSILGLPAALLTLLPLSTWAQTDVEELGRRYGASPPPAYYQVLQMDPNAFQFSPENGWVRRGRQIAAERNRRRGRQEEGVFRTQAAHDVAGVMVGDVYVPAFLVLFSNTDSADIATNVPAASLQSRLYGTDPAPPYSIHTYYREVSNDSLRVYGTVYDWAFVPEADSVYEGSSNGLTPPYMGPMMRDIAAVWDDSVDFGQFDNDGPDGIPNSSDDDGFVDAVVLIHPKVDGSCMAVNPEAESAIWAHRFFSGPYPTNDPSNATGGVVMLRDYIVQGGQGGDGGCTSDQPQAMGVVAHETGHLFDLPDLYEIGGNGAGIGRWGLMGSGSQLTAARPTHLSAFSKAQLGWITEVPIERDTTLVMSPVVTSDTAYYLKIPNTPEYYLLENRQRIGSDTNLYSEGLLIWHVDSFLVNNRGNNVNTPGSYAVALEQADGQNHLGQGTNRGDSGDPFPGSLENRSFGRNTTPSSLSNLGYVSTIELDSIEQVEAFGAIRLRIGFETQALIATTDSNATFLLNGEEYTRFEGFLTSGADYSLDMESPQYVDSGRRRLDWVSWSNGQPKSHTFTASVSGDTITANVTGWNQLTVTTTGTGSGSVIGDVTLDLEDGEFLADDSTVTLVATADSVGHIFEQWGGPDTTATGDTLVLEMSRPFSLEALFAAPLAITDDSFPAALMGTEYRHQLTAGGGTGSAVWGLTSASLPHGLSMSTSGLVAGLPEEVGAFQVNVEVSSGAQLVTETLSFSVAAPVIAVADVLTHLVGAGETLSDEEIAYLDLLGNDNTYLDVGDFLAWVEADGVQHQDALLHFEAIDRLRSVADSGEGREPGGGR